MALDVYMTVQHGPKLIMRNMFWKVAEEGIHNTGIEGQVFEFLGIDKREVLLTARDKYGDDIDVMKGLMHDGNEKEKNGTIAALHTESTLHRDGSIEDDGLNKKDAYVDLGDDEQELVEEEVKNRVDETFPSSMYSEGTNQIKQIIEKQKSIFKMRFGSEGPAAITATKIK